MNSAKNNYMMRTFSGRMILATIAALVLSAAFGASALGQGSIERVSEWTNPAATKAAARAAQASALSSQAPPLAPDAANNYVFTSATNGTFTNMSSGTTQLVGPADDASSVVTNLGFDFYFLGTRYTQFSVNSNGYIRLGGTAVSTTQYTLGTATFPLIAALGSDLFVSTTGKVHYKVTGSAPNRVLTVEWLNMTMIYDGVGTATDGTYQVRLNETTGVIELIYGPMNRNSSTGFGGGMDPQFMGFSINNTANNFASVDTANTNSNAALNANQFPLGAAMASLNSPVDGSRRIYTFTPATPTAPTILTFTGVNQLAMTLNWVDSPDESLYAIYRSTDGVNYSFLTTAAQNAVSFNATGLSPSTTYFWQVYAISDGAFSTALSGSQATPAPGVVTSTAAGGPWSSTATWAGGTVPTNTDDVTIADGATVTIDTAAVALDVTVGQGVSGILQWDIGVVRTLTVGLNVTVAAGGTFNTGAAGAITTHVLSVGGNLTNNGTLDFSTNGNTAGAGITFTGATNNTFGGTGATTNLRTLTINKGTSNANILELNPTNFTVQGTTTDGAPMAFLTLTNGTLKVSGTFIASGRVFTAAAYTIPATAGFWLNNSSFAVVGQNGSPTEAGLLRISQGTFNIGTATGNSMGFSTGSTIIVEGGSVSATGRFGVGAAGNAITYTQTGGFVTVCTVGNASATLGSFDLGTSLTSSISMTGGTIIVQLASTGATQIDYRDQAGSGFTGVTGGTLQLGNAASGAAKAFSLRGVLPNLVITNTSANHTASMSTTLVNYNNISRNVTINTGNTMNFGNVVFLFAGTVLTNNGTLTHNGASSNFVWFLTTAPESYTGSGTVTAPMSNFAMQADQGLTIDPASPAIVTNAVRLFSGSIINSNKLTIGNGGVTSSIVQIGNTTTPTAAGTFDTAPTFNPGSAGIIMSYLRTTTSRSTGPEVPATRTITTFTRDDNDVTHTLTLAGGDLTVTGVTALTNGRIVTGANTQIVGSAGTVTRTTGLVDGNFRKTYTAVSSKLFEVGTANGFSPVTVNVTAGTFPADFTVKAVQGPQPNILVPTKALQRYWTLTGTGVTADLTFTYLDPTDIPVTANENIFFIWKFNGSFTTPGGTVNTGANTANITGVSSFSDWTLAEPLAPTAAPASISGQVTTPSGAPLPGVTMYLSGARSARAITDSNGNYRFGGVDTDNFYTVTPAIVNYQFSPASRSFSLLANKTDAVFTGTRNAVSGGNVIDSPEFFVRQHYLDFLGREPDESGLNFWSDQIIECGNDFVCMERRTINVSAAYFLSIEFQETGGLVNGLYGASYGRAPLFDEFMPDSGTVARDLIVGQPGWQARLATNKQEFLDAWVQRAAFRAAYDNLTNDSYVDTLITHTGVEFSGAERAALVSGLNDSTLTRAVVLQRVAQDERFVRAKFNEAFVRMQYFGYLRRDPDDRGFHFWLDKLNEFEGNFERAEMVKAFLVSGEYRERFRQ